MTVLQFERIVYMYNSLIISTNILWTQIQIISITKHTPVNLYNDNTVKTVYIIHIIYIIKCHLRKHESVSIYLQNQITKHLTEDKTTYLNAYWTGLEHNLNVSEHNLQLVIKDKWHQITNPYLTQNHGKHYF